MTGQMWALVICLAVLLGPIVLALLWRWWIICWEVFLG